MQYAYYIEYLPFYHFDTYTEKNREQKKKCANDTWITRWEYVWYSVSEKKAISRTSYRIGLIPSIERVFFSIMKFWNKQIKCDIIEVERRIFQLLSLFCAQFFILANCYWF